MTYFIDLRAEGRGGSPVDSIESIVIRSDANPNPNPSRSLEPDLTAAIQGRDMLLATHGFNVSRSDGLAKLSHWNQWIVPGANGLLIGVLWPGDSRWIPVLDYPIEGDEAIKSGQLLADYLSRKCSGVRSLSFASHSLGVRTILETIRHIKDLGLFRLETFITMAGAIDDTCLNGEYADSAPALNKIVALCSRCDDVLKWAFPAGNPVAGLVTRGEPYWHGALGRYGSNPPGQPLNLASTPILPDSWNFGHHSYIGCQGAQTGPPQESGPFYPPTMAVPSAGTPTPSNALNWQEAWAAGFVSSEL